MTLEDLVDRDQQHAYDGIDTDSICVRIMGVANLPSRFGQFKIIAFSNKQDGKDHIAIVHGDIIDAENVPTRLHSECLTGDTLGSLRCDCRDQLEAALLHIATQPCGIVLYLRQEGRGIGLMNKIRAYQLQDQGLDTVDANLALGFRDDERDYQIAAHMLKSLTVRSICLMTNNPSKMTQLTQYGIRIVGRIPHILPPNPHNRSYLETKAARSGHFIEFETLSEQPLPVDLNTDQT